MSCVSSLLDTIFEYGLAPCLNPDDDFVLIIRKIVCSLYGLASFFGLAAPYYAWRATQVSDQERGSVVALALLVGLFGFVMCLPTFLYMRCTKSAPDWLMMYCLVLAALITCSWDVFTTFFPVRSTCIAIALMTLASRTSGGGFVVVFLIVYYLIVEVRDAFNLPLRIANPYTGTGVEKIIFSLPGVLAVTLMPLLQMGTVHEYLKLITGAKSSVKLAQEVAELLMVYDTDGVREQIASAKKQNENLEAALVTAFEQIAENLDIYRPHLPAYVLPRDDMMMNGNHGEEEDIEFYDGVEQRSRDHASSVGTGGGGGAGDNQSMISTHTMRMRQAAKKRQDDNDSLASDNASVNSASSNLQNSNNNNNHSSGSTGSGGFGDYNPTSGTGRLGPDGKVSNRSTMEGKSPLGPAGKSSSASYNATSKSNRHNSSNQLKAGVVTGNNGLTSQQQQQQQMAGNINNNPKSSMAFLTGHFWDRIILCKINLVKLPKIIFGEDLKNNKDIASAVINKIMEGLLDLAAHYEATVHAVVADCVAISWNAAVRTSHSDLKACRFLVGLDGAVRKVLLSAITKDRFIDTATLNKNLGNAANNNKSHSLHQQQQQQLSQFMSSAAIAVPPSNFVNAFFDENNHDEISNNNNNNNSKAFTHISNFEERKNHSNNNNNNNITTSNILLSRYFVAPPSRPDSFSNDNTSFSMNGNNVMNLGKNNYSAQQETDVASLPSNTNSGMNNHNTSNINYSNHNTGSITSAQQMSLSVLSQTPHVQQNHLQGQHHYSNSTSIATLNSNLPKFLNSNLNNNINNNNPRTSDFSTSGNILVIPAPKTNQNNNKDSVGTSTPEGQTTTFAIQIPRQQQQQLRQIKKDANNDDPRPNVVGEGTRKHEDDDDDDENSIKLDDGDHSQDGAAHGSNLLPNPKYNMHTNQPSKASPFHTHENSKIDEIQPQPYASGGQFPWGAQKNNSILKNSSHVVKTQNRAGGGTDDGGDSDKASNYSNASYSNHNNHNNNKDDNSSGAGGAAAGAELSGHQSNKLFGENNNNNRRMSSVVGQSVGVINNREGSTSHPSNNNNNNSEKRNTTSISSNQHEERSSSSTQTSQSHGALKQNSDGNSLTGGGAGLIQQQQQDKKSSHSLSTQNNTNSGIINPSAPPINITSSSSTLSSSLAAAKRNTDNTSSSLPNKQNNNNTEDNNNNSNNAGSHPTFIPDVILTAAAVSGSAWSQVAGSNRRQMFMLSAFSNSHILDEAARAADIGDFIAVCRNVQSSAQLEFHLRGCAVVPSQMDSLRYTFNACNQLVWNSKFGKHVNNNSDNNNTTMANEGQDQQQEQGPRLYPTPSIIIRAALKSALNNSRNDNENNNNNNNTTADEPLSTQKQNKHEQEFPLLKREPSSHVSDGLLLPNHQQEQVAIPFHSPITEAEATNGTTTSNEGENQNQNNNNMNNNINFLRVPSSVRTQTQPQLGTKPQQQNQLQSETFKLGSFSIPNATADKSNLQQQPQNGAESQKSGSFKNNPLLQQQQRQREEAKEEMRHRKLQFDFFLNVIMTGKIPAASQIDINALIADVQQHQQQLQQQQQQNQNGNNNQQSNKNNNYFYGNGNNNNLFNLITPGISPTSTPGALFSPKSNTNNIDDREHHSTSTTTRESNQNFFLLRNNLNSNTNNGATALSILQNDNLESPEVGGGANPNYHYNNNNSTTSGATSAGGATTVANAAAANAAGNAAVAAAASKKLPVIAAPIYELVCRKKLAKDDDEWLYVINEKKDGIDPAQLRLEAQCTALCDAVAYLARGQVYKTVAVMNKLVEEHPQSRDLPSFRCVEDSMERFARIIAANPENFPQFFGSITNIPSFFSGGMNINNNNNNNNNNQPVVTFADTSSQSFIQTGTVNMNNNYNNNSNCVASFNDMVRVNSMSHNVMMNQQQNALLSPYSNQKNSAPNDGFGGGVNSNSEAADTGIYPSHPLSMATENNNHNNNYSPKMNLHQHRKPFHQKTNNSNDDEEEETQTTNPTNDLENNQNNSRYHSGHFSPPLHREDTFQFAKNHNNNKNNNSNIINNVNARNYAHNQSSPLAQLGTTNGSRNGSAIRTDEDSTHQMHFSHHPAQSQTNKNKNRDNADDNNNIHHTDLNTTNTSSNSKTGKDNNNNDSSGEAVRNSSTKSNHNNDKQQQLQNHGERQQPPSPGVNPSNAFLSHHGSSNEEATRTSNQTNSNNNNNNNNTNNNNRMSVSKNGLSASHQGSQNALVLSPGQNNLKY